MTAHHSDSTDTIAAVAAYKPSILDSGDIPLHRQQPHSPSSDRGAATTTTGPGGEDVTYSFNNLESYRQEDELIGWPVARILALMQTLKDTTKTFRTENTMLMAFAKTIDPRELDTELLSDFDPNSASNQPPPPPNFGTANIKDAIGQNQQQTGSAQPQSTPGGSGASTAQIGGPPARKPPGQRHTRASGSRMSEAAAALGLTVDTSSAKSSGAGGDATKKTPRALVIALQKLRKQAQVPPAYQGPRVRLHNEQKMDIAFRYQAELKDERDAFRQKHQNRLDILRAKRDAARMRLEQLKKDTGDFEREVSKDVELKKEVVQAERLIRYLEDKLRWKETQTEKLRLKNQTAKVQVTKLEFQLQQKDELGESLTQVDFDKLEIECRQLSERLNERIQESHSMKLEVSHAVQILNTLKRDLNDVLTRMRRVEAELRVRRDVLNKVTNEQEHVHEEKKALSGETGKMLSETRMFKVPTVSDYIAIEEDLARLHKEIMSLKRKNEIAEMAWKSATRMWNYIKQQAASFGMQQPGGAVQNHNISTMPAPVAAT